MARDDPRSTVESGPTRVAGVGAPRPGPGDIVGGYRLEAVAGSGGMGVVHRATDLTLGRRVALKLIAPHLAGRPRFRALFVREALSAAAVEHPAVVPVYRAGEDDGTLFLAMRWIEGLPLDELAAGDGLSPEIAVAIVSQVAAALDAAHTEGVIHRDVKPANILVSGAATAPVAHLTDFGLALLVSESGEGDSSLGAGTPGFQSPEQIRGGPVTPATDVYALGGVLHFCLTGRAPYPGISGDALRIAQLVDPPPRPSRARPALPRTLDAVVATAMAKRPAGRFETAGDLARAAERAIADAGDGPALGVAGARSGLCPYRGLQAFEEEHADRFVGREADVARMLDKLREHRFVALVGASGVGKSSLLHAGLIPAVRRGALGGPGAATVVALTPGDAPLASLAAALAAGPPRPALLVVDALEEAFTLCADDAERTAFLDALLDAAGRPGSHVVVALRADVYGRIAGHERLASAVADGQHLLGHLGPSAVRRAVLEPAAAAGLTVEPALVETVVGDFAGSPEALPLLGFALREVWRRRRDHTLTLRDYEDAGGLRGTLERRAEEVMSELSGAEMRIAREVLLRLVQPGETGLDTRCRAAADELAGADPAAEALVQRLVRARLLAMTSDLASGTRVVEIAHEQLLRSWSRLADWIAAERAALRAEHRLADTAADWEAHGRDPAFLLAGPRLQEWDARPDGRLTEAAKAFLTAGRDAAAGRRRARRRRRLTTVAVSLAVLAAVGTLGAVALRRGDEAAAQRIDGRADRLLAASAQRSATDPELALLYAEEAYRLRPDAAAQTALRRTVAASRILAATGLGGDLGHPVALLHGTPARALTDRGRIVRWPSGGGPPRDTARLPVGTAARVVSAGAGLTAVVSEGGRADVWSLAGAPRRMLIGIEASDVVAAADAPRLAVVTNHGDLRVVGPSGEERRLDGDPRYVTRPVLSADGGTLAFYRPTVGVTVVRLPDGRGTRLAGGAGDRWNALAVSGSGSRVAAVDPAGTVRVWDTATGTGRNVPGRRTGRDRLLLSRDGRRLVAIGRSGSLAVWDLRQGGHPVVRRVNQGVVTAVALDDADRVAVGGRNGSVRVWDIRTGDGLALGRHTGPVVGLGFGDDGRTLVSAAADGLRRWDIATAIPWIVPTASPSSDVALSGDGRTVAVISARGVVTVAHGATVRSRAIARALPARIALSPDAQTVVTAESDGRVASWRWRAGDVRVLHAGAGLGGGSPGAVVGGRWWLTADRRGTILRPLWAPGAALRFDLPGVTVAVSEDARRLVTAARISEPAVGAGGVAEPPELEVAGWDLEQRPPTRRWTLRGDWPAVALAADGRTVALSGRSGIVRIVAERPGGGTSVSAGARGADSLAIGADGRLLVAGGAAGAVRSWDTRTGVQVAEFRGLRGAIRDVATDRTGTRVAAIGSGPFVAVWTCETCGSMSDVLALAARRTTRGLSASERGAVDAP